MASELVTKGTKRAAVGGDGVVGKVSAYYSGEPFPLCVERQVHPFAQLVPE